MNLANENQLPSKLSNDNLQLVNTIPINWRTSTLYFDIWSSLALLRIPSKRCQITLSWTDKNEIKYPSYKQILFLTGRVLTYIHTQKLFRNLIKSNQNQIVFTILRLIWNQTDVHLVQINHKMVNTIWFQFDLIRFQKDFSVYLGTIYARNFFFQKNDWDCDRFL